MTRLGLMFNTLVLGVALSAPCTVVADDQDTVDYRKDVMKSIDGSAAAIQLIVQKKAPADDLVAHVKVLAISAAMAKSVFEPNVDGGASKPEVWSNWADFAKRLDAMAAATDDLAKAAASGGVAAVAPKLPAVMATCKSCHEQYSTAKK